MSHSDYFRPADYQVLKLYRCDGQGCHAEMELSGDLVPPGQHACGGTFVEYAKSYPPADEWDEERDETTGEWVNRRGR